MHFRNKDWPRRKPQILFLHSISINLWLATINYRYWLRVKMNKIKQRNSWYWINLVIIINFCKDCTSWFVCEVRQYTAWQVIHVSRITVPTHLKTIINWSCTYINKFESPAVPISWYSEHVLNLTSEHVTRCTRSEAADERVR